MIAGLEQYFGALVGANIYMTPPNAQGLGTLQDPWDVDSDSALTSKRSLTCFCFVHSPMRRSAALRRCRGVHPSTRGQEEVEALLSPGFGRAPA
jgi:hypothetical protein